MGSKRIRRMFAATVLALAVGGVAAVPPVGAAEPFAPGPVGPPVTHEDSALDAVLDADGSGWLVQPSDSFGLGITARLARRAADGTITSYGQVWGDDSDPCNTYSIGGTVGRPQLLAGDQLCSVAADGTVTPHAVPAGTVADVLAVDPDGTMWFAGEGAVALGRLDPDGSLHAVTLPPGGASTVGIGPDGRPRVGQGPEVLRVAADGTVTVDVVFGGEIDQVLTGPDGRVWAWQECPAGSCAQLVASGDNGSYSVRVTEPAYPGEAVTAGGRAWYGRDRALVGVAPDGAARTIGIGLTTGGLANVGEDIRTHVLGAAGDLLYGASRQELWSYDATSPFLDLRVTASASRAPTGEYVVRVEGRDEEGVVLAGTVDLFRRVSGAGTLAPYSYSNVASAHVEGAGAQVTVAPVEDCSFPISPGPVVAVFRPDGEHPGGQVPVAWEGLSHQAVSVVQEVFRRVLGRTAEPGAVDFWGGRWDAKPQGGPLAASLLRTREAEVRVVDGVYRQTLHRRVDAGSVEHWRAELRRVGQRRITATIIASGEAYARAGGTAPGWVAWAYDALLDRAPTPTELAAEVARLQGGASRGSVATRLLTSREGIAHRIVLVKEAMGLEAETSDDEVDAFTTEEALRLALAPSGLESLC